jgi:flagellar biosynthesis protein FlhG
VVDSSVVQSPTGALSRDPARQLGPASVGRIIAVGGGKGGVGKSLVSTNLAVTMARMGARVVVLDADLGAPNLHSLFGIPRPDRTVDDFLAGRAGSLDDVALPTAVPGLRLICGAEGVLGAANPSFQTKQKLLSQLGRLSADCLLIDVGAGVDLNTVDFFNAADIRLVVMVPEITSLQNGYGFLKIALFRRLQRAIAGLRVADKVTEAFGKDAFEIGSTMDRVSTFFSLLEDEVPELVAQIRPLLVEFNAQIIGNMLQRPQDANALYAIQRLVRDRLEIGVEIAAGLRHNPQVRGSVNTGQPFASVAHKNDPDALELRSLASKILHQDLAPLRRIREDFLRTMSRPSADGSLDRRFQFGLEGVEAERPTPVVREPRAAAPQAQFSSEFRQLQRVSQRIKLYAPVEVSFDGRWYLGQMTEVNDAGGCVSGIRAESSWTAGRLRLVDEPATQVGIQVHSAEPGRLIFTFDDTAAPALVAELRRRVPPAPAN